VKESVSILFSWKIKEAKMSLSIARVALSKRLLTPKVSIPFMQTSISSFTTAAPAGVAPQQHAPPKNRIKPVSNGREFLDKLKGKVEKVLACGNFRFCPISHMFL
jgi:hypothetical protein